MEISDSTFRVTLIELGEKECGIKVIDRTFPFLVIQLIWAVNGPNIFR